MYLPSSTYRLQFNKDFTFKDLHQILPYITSLRPGAIYSSPVFGAVPESKHGYDITDPHNFNPEIGTADQFNHIRVILKRKGIGWVQDIVPNHMAFHPHNKWLMDVLKYGRESEFAGFFDIDWDHPVYKNKLIVPVLVDSFEDSVKNARIRLKAMDKELFVAYNDFMLPVNPASANQLPGNMNYPEEICSITNSEPLLLTSLLSKQHYVLTRWQQVNTSLNYRRFFTINGLISLRMEDPFVFKKYHEFIFRMTDNGSFNGIRLDHVDGLSKPVEYFSRLRARTGEDVYIIAEKILEQHENFQNSWPLQGSSGYDFMSLLNGLFTGEGISKLAAFYSNETGITEETEDVIYENKSAVLNSGFGGDLDNICRFINDNKLISFTSSVTPARLKESVAEFLIHCPVYKLYSDDLPLNETDLAEIGRIIEKASSKKPYLRSSLASLKKLFSISRVQADHNVRNLFLRIMQYTGPLMAKGVEDTAMYSRSMFIARNEVGDSIDAPSVSIEEFHDRMTKRRDLLPASLNATATHDTKRGEDSRARLNVISDIPEIWIRFYRKWSTITKKHTVKSGDVIIPDTNEQYFICQVILGALPMNGQPDNSFLKRLDGYLRKALREAKIHSNWNNPDTFYEDAVVKYTGELLSDPELLKLIKPFFEKIRDSGIINSLSQVVLKSMCPGIPDFYQGTEFWDLSFVDPDNRRPVDYARRKKVLSTLQFQSESNPESFFARLYDSRLAAGIKLWITHRLMGERAADPHAFVYAQYLPLEVKGPRRKNILAFARVFNEMWYIVVVPLHMGMKKSAAHGSPADFRVCLPRHAPENWMNLWDNIRLQSVEGHLEGDILPLGYPVVLKGRCEKSKRGSGILLHITSLPGKYGTGSLGHEAFEFVRLLRNGGQKFWQILPLNPAGISHSPYSSSSAFAGNMLFIDPAMLFRHNYIRKLPAPFNNGVKSDFAKAMVFRKKLLKEAYENFITADRALTRKNFYQFCADNKYWLDDYALFSLIGGLYQSGWVNWPERLKKRDRKALNALINKNQPEIEQIKFIQFLFHEQFRKLKEHCEYSGIKIIGDLPIYVAYNSADVWANPDLFNLDHDLNMLTVAGVPPDFFSSNGQLWNMPVYNWNKMKEQDYQWWKKRIENNLKYCDLIRLDHFRALSAFWEIPAGEKTAKNGKWTPGPANDFLNAMKNEFPDLPFIAEDLGDIDNNVLKLRNRFMLPGMRVLMFAFDEGMPNSFHIPHNFHENSVVYTGTHDNNTVKGWFRESNDGTKKRIMTYLGRHTDASTISWELIRLALTSVSKTAIIPMQDLLSLDESGRLNTPARLIGNWKWKLAGFSGLDEAINRLYKLTYFSGRI